MTATKRHLVGRSITAVAWKRQWDPNRQVWITNPRLTLDNGAELYFVTQESDLGDYGTTICIHPKEKKTT